MKKANTILSILVFLLLMVALSATCHSQTIVRIDSVHWVGNWRAKITGTGTNGHRVYLHYGFSRKTKQYVVPGRGLYVVEMRGRNREGFKRSKITIYNR